MGYYWIILLLPAFFGSSHGFCGAPPRLYFGQLDSQFNDVNNFSTDATVTYSCQLGFIRAFGTRNVITCLNDSTWSTPEIFCTRRQCGAPGDIENGKMSIIDTLFGSRVNYTCNLGYNMQSKRDYRECLADGTWSNEVPVCDVQKCAPPNAITDGIFRPDEEEYNYQDAVSYECNNKTLSLIGEKTLSCTAFGNWSLDPPRCKAVECKAPNVDNANKLSGFIEPYTLNSAVRFQCFPGYTMVGSSLVICSESNEWEPPLPTCNRIVTPTPATTKGKETETGGSTVTQRPSSTKEKDENNGGSTVTQNPTKQENDKENGEGNNIGAVTGNTLIIFSMSVMAILINIGF